MTLKTDDFKYVKRGDPIILNRRNAIRNLTLRDLLDNELQIARDGDDMKLIIRDGNNVWSITLNKEI